MQTHYLSCILLYGYLTILSYFTSNTLTDRWKIARTNVRNVRTNVSLRSVRCVGMIYNVSHTGFTFICDLKKKKSKCHIQSLQCIPYFPQNDRTSGRELPGERRGEALFTTPLFRDGMPSLSSSYNISGLVPVCWLLFQCF